MIFQLLTQQMKLIHFINSTDMLSMDSTIVTHLEKETVFCLKISGPMVLVSGRRKSDRCKKENLTCVGYWEKYFMAQYCELSQDFSLSRVLDIRRHR
jgi:hypothetical protein